MSGILVYTKEEAVRNAFAVRKFTENLDVILVDENYDGNADFVINRTNDYRVGERFEKRGVRVFNSSSLSRLANDKQLCYEFMERHGVPIMPVNYEEVPAVKKSVDGHGGKEVFWLNEKEPFEKGFVYQKPCDTLGKDLRVWVLGGKIVCSILRESKTDFRSNFCLGGSAVLYEMNDEEKALVQKIISLVNADYIGIDLIFNGGHPVFNEIEDTVGARMVYSKTDIDIIKMYCDYIKKNAGL
ncbi:MAG: ATP-grasp domain-containing protein [Eubacteriales bacterium]|nr:ATP-grasp domain-containing protein [Eubacteriales bacterium]